VGVEETVPRDAISPALRTEFQALADKMVPAEEVDDEEEEEEDRSNDADNDAKLEPPAAKRIRMVSPGVVQATRAALRALAIRRLSSNYNFVYHHASI